MAFKEYFPTGVNKVQDLYMRKSGWKILEEVTFPGQVPLLRHFWALWGDGGQSQPYQVAIRSLLVNRKGGNSS